MKFNIEDYKGRYAMHCKTEEEAKDFCNYLHNIGKKWCDDQSYAKNNHYDKYEKDTVYNFNEDAYADVSFYRDVNYTILEWSDFMDGKFTKADLRTGDVIRRRNGSVEIVNRELKTLICKRGWKDLDDIREDLTDKDCLHYDIVAVRRPREKGDCCFDAFGCERGTLVYERKEVEEMTLAEVCKLLGKEIKIVK